MAKKKKSARKKSFQRKPVDGKRVTKKKSYRRRTSTRNSPTGPTRYEEQRLQRALANAGLGSRRDCETLIEEGRVEVDGKIVTKLGTKVRPREQKIRVDGNAVKFARLQYFAVNKPPGVVSTSSDPSGRMRVIDLIKTNERVYNVGRLDKSSEGLMLVTNDGDLANRLTHPRYGVQKIYMVQVAGRPEVADLKKLQRGVYLAEGLAKVVGTKIKKRTKDSTWLEMTLEEGRNREIRRLLASIGHKVLRLRRVAIGSLRLAELPIGAHRKLDKHEIEGLWHSGPRQRSAAKKSRHRKTSTASSTRKPAKTMPRKRNDDPDRKKPYKDRDDGSDSKKPFGKRDSSDSKKKSFKSRKETESRGSRSASASLTGRRKAKPKVGEKGWTPKSGGKRRKKKSTAVTRTPKPGARKRSVNKSKRRK
jgi:23S rRNA pseudouridine2605 synthase